MNMQHIIEQCAQNGINITLEESGIALTGNKHKLTQELLDLIRSNKEELTQYITSFNSATTGNKDTTIQPIDRSGPMSLSPTQERLWLANCISGESPEYNMPGACEISGPFYFDAATRALNEIVRRHEVLRTTYHESDSGPIQTVQQQFELSIKKHDLTPLAAGVKQDALVKLLKEDINRPFDLEKDLMLRASYIELEKGEQERGVLLFNTHHIAFDGWSMEVLHKEFFVLYQAFISEQPSPLPKLDIQYADYANWQLKQLDSAESKRQLNYWQQNLEELPQCHSLPLSFERPPVKQQEGALVERILSADIAIGLKKLATAYQLTPFMLLHGALALVISRHSGSHDIVIGSPFANRLKRELEPLIGFFVNTLTLRCNTQHESIGDYFNHIKQTHVNAQSNQDVPFTKLVDLMKVPRNSAYTPLFQIMLTTENDFGVNQEANSMELAGSTLSAMAPDTVAVKSPFDLDISISLSEHGVKVKFIYDVALFSQDKVEEINHHLCQLLNTLAFHSEHLDPCSSLSTLSMLTTTEKQNIDNTLNGEWVDYDAEVNIQTLFEKQVALNPQQLAVESETQQLSYQQLNRQANQLAALLRAQFSIEPDTLVGISMGRSCQMIMTILAVLKAGGAYLPLDPSYPQERLNAMIEDAGVKVIISDPHIASSLQFENCQTVSFSESDFEAYPDTNPDYIAQNLTTDNLAYVIYTSGSTGKPKGVMIEHRNLNHFLVNTKQRYRLSKRDKVLQFSTMNFDIFVEEMFSTLCCGATLVLRNQDCMSGRNAFSQFCQQHGVTVVSLPTAFWHQINAGPDKVNSDKLRLVILGGEALQTESVNAYFEQVNNVELINSYGPTEATVTATGFHITENTIKRTVPIGSANVNTNLMILDEKQGILPLGAVGELYIGGAGLARGYLNKPELTAERFVANPYYNPAQPQSSKRLYKTGDLVACNSQGELEFHGRIDDQIKIRGFRIELGEIENQLASLDLIEVALVMAIETEQGTKQLIAYLQPVSLVNGRQDILKSVRNQLAKQLPEYMIPSSFVIVDDWPMMPNGKVDKKVLATLQSDEPAEIYVAPQNELEHALQVIWSEVLRINNTDLSVEANFFDMGGHSLTAVKLVSMVREQLQYEITVSDIFEAQSIRNMAVKLSETTLQTVRPAIERMPRKELGMPLSFAQQRLWFIDKLRGGSSEYNMPVALEVIGELDENAVGVAMQRIIDRHEALRTVFHDTYDGVLQHIINDPVFTLQQIDISHLSGSAQRNQLQTLLLNDAQRPFNLSHDLMVRACTILLSKGCENSPKKSVLVFNMHHIASDGWSMEILTKEFVAHYQSIVTGRPVLMEPLEIQYADFAAWQRKLLQGDTLKNQSAYWQQQLKGVPAVHSLPLDFSRPKSKQFKGASESAHLSCEVGEALVNVANMHKMTPFMLMHAALALVLSRHSNSRDIVVGTPISNRTQAELEPIIGFFANTLVLRVDTGVSSLGEYLKQVREVHLGAQENQDLPFEQLVEGLNIERDTSHSPVFQIMVTTNASQHANRNSSEPISIPNLQLTPLNSDATVAKFDLSIQLDINDTGVNMHWIYDTALFQSHTIIKMIQNLKRCLNGIAELNKASISNMPLADIPMLSKLETHFLVNKFNNTRIAYAKDICLHHDIESHAITTPDQVAVICDKQQLSFAQLNNRANQLAHHLINNCDVQPGQLIGLCTSRSMDMLIGILAILKAGAAYVPLDPSYPEARLHYIVDDAKLTTVLVQSSHTTCLPKNTLQQVLLDGEKHSDCPTFNPNITLAQPIAEQIAYVIYTSGSTGKPKGVCQTHGTLMSFSYEFDEQLQVLGVADCSPWLWTASYAFDASIKGLVCLALGKPVVVASETECAEPQNLVKLIIQHRIEVFNAVPQLLELLVDDLAGVPVHLISSGDDLNSKTLDKLLNYTRAVGTRLINAYGPTETGVNSSYALIRDRAVIGRPTLNTELLILDACGRLVPKGAIGELHIGGAGLAQGYLHRPALTKEKFVANPYYDGSRLNCSPKLYKSGDLVRMLEDGDLQFIGRVDDQIKIRGFRIELGEIKSELCALPQVASAAVVRHQSTKDVQQLIAYIVPQEDKNTSQPFDVDAMKETLAQTLPNYMVPDFILVLDELPTNASGKLNRTALPTPHDLITGNHHVAAENQTEQSLLTIWSILLGVNTANLSVTTDFFAAGGHSLLAVKLLAEIRKQLHVDLTLAQLFDATTIRQQAQLVEQEQGISQHEIINSVPREQLMPLSSAQQRLWAIHSLQGGSSEYNIPAAVHVEGDLDIDAAKSALNTIVARHEILRTNYVQTKDGPRQCVQHKVEVPFALHNLCELDTDTKAIRINEIIELEANTSFDLELDVMMKAGFILTQNTPSKEGILIFNVHHIASDGWSMEVLRKEFLTLYQAYSKGLTNPLPPLSIQYIDYAQWQQEQQRKAQSIAQLAYWENQLHDLPAVHNLPLKSERSAVKSNVGLNLEASIEPKICKALTALAQEYKMTPFMLLHGAVALSLSKTSGEKDIVVGTPTAGRLLPELSPLIGFFVNTIVLRANTEYPTLHDYLTHIKKVHTEAQINQGVQFDQLVEKLNVQRNRSHTPLFQVMLTAQNDFDVSLPDTTEKSSIEELMLSPLEIDSVSCKFDIDIKVKITESGGTVSWNYDSSLFNHELIELLNTHFMQVLTNLTSMKSDTKHRLLLTELTNTAITEQVIPKNNDVDKECLPNTSSTTTNANITLAMSKSVPSSQIRKAENNTEAELTTLWSSLLGSDCSYLSTDTNFFSVGGNSLLAISLAKRIQQHFDVNFTSSMMFDHQTIHEQSIAVQKLTQSGIPNDDQTLVKLRSGMPSMPPIFLIHPLGGKVFCYNEIVSKLGRELPIFGLQTPSHGFESLTAMASHYLSLVRRQAPGGTINLVGWSMGGVIAHEMQRLALSQGDVEVNVAMIDSYPTTDNAEEVDDLSLIYMIASELGVRATDEEISQLKKVSVEQALEYLHQAAIAQHRLPEDTSVQELTLHFQIIKNNNQLFNDHQMQPSNGRTLLIASSEHQRVAEWQVYCDDVTNIVIPESDHFSIVGATYSHTVVTNLKSMLYQPADLKYAK
ncbi:amino acid adenylation domain-containing protein [Shewanella waksmanii]|uniref:non-ribosomal peptide synthetase n=1 Tax=Shewanella waksmanii TaxID=213783 RepID=UPI00373693A9